MMSIVQPIRSLVAALALGAGLVTSASAQSPQEMGELRLQMGQLAEQVRQLTGEVERLRFQLQQLQAASGVEPAFQAGQIEVFEEPAMGAPGANSSALAGAPPADLGGLSIAQDDPRVAPDGSAGLAGAPLDLSALAGGSVNLDVSPGFGNVPQGGTEAAPGAAPQAQPGQAAPQMAALGGNANDQYDLAYGYVLTGDYGVAEQSFRQWLQANAGHPLAGDAEFWLAESLLRQDKHRDAANLFLKLYKGAPQGRKAPDSLAKLGMALAALGEKSAACATFKELDRKHPDASALVKSQVAAEAQRAGC